MAAAKNSQNHEYQRGERDSLQEHIRRMKDFRRAHAADFTTRGSQRGYFQEHISSPGILRRFHSCIFGSKAPERGISAAEFVPVSPVAQATIGQGGSKQPIGSSEYSALIPLWNSGTRRFSVN